MHRFQIKNYINKYRDDKVFYDPRFQRKYGAWDDQQKREFIISALFGRNYHNTVKVDIQACLDFMNECCPDDSRSIAYYQELLDSGYVYISLDGRHRTRVLTEFLNNEFTISGLIVDADDKRLTVENKFFKDLPPRVQDHFKTGCHMNVAHEEKAHPNELSMIFKRLQGGCPLNGQEQRQPDVTPVADFVRDAAYSFDDVIRMIVNENEYCRSIGDEIIAKMLMEIINKYNIPGIKTLWGFQASQIDKWYALGLGHYSFDDPDCPYNKEEFQTRATHILVKFFAVLKNQNTYGDPNKTKGAKRLPKKFIWPILHACEYAYDNDMYISDHQKFLDNVIAIDKAECVASEGKYAQLRIAKIHAGRDPDIVSKEDYYFRWAEVPHQSTQRAKRKAEFLKTLSLKKYLSKCALRYNQKNSIVTKSKMEAA